MVFTISTINRLLKLGMILVIVSCVSFFLFGGELNLHLPSILSAEAGYTAVEAASFYSMYNVAGMVGKLLAVTFFSVPALKKGLLLYIPFPLAFMLSHFLLLTCDLSRWRGTKWAGKG